MLVGIDKIGVAKIGFMLEGRNANNKKMCLWR